MVMGSNLPIVLVTLCLLLYGDVVSGLKDGGRRIRRIKVADLPLTSAAPPHNSTTLPVATSKTVASVVAEDILQSGGGISAPGSTNTSSLPTAPSYDSYLFGTSEDGDEGETSDFGTVATGDKVEEQNGRRKTNRDKHDVNDAGGYSATLTTPRMSLFDEHHSQVSEGIRQRLEELEERFHSSHSPNFETSPSSESYSRLTMEPGSKENGTMEMDYSNRFSLVFNETYDPPRNIHRETLMENATRLNMESTMLVHKEYQETELNSNLSTKNPTIVSADVKKKKKIIVVPEVTTDVSVGDSKTQESQSTELPEETNLYHTTGPPGDRNSTTSLPDIRGRSISQRLFSNITAPTSTKESLETSPQVEDSEANLSISDAIATNMSSSEAEDKGRSASLRNYYSTTDRFIGLLQSTTEGSATEHNATEGTRGGRMLVNENSTNSLGAEASQVPPSPAVPSTEQGDKMGMRTKTTLRRLNRTDSQSITERFTSRPHSTTESITTSLSTSPSATTEWRSRSRSYPQRRPYAAAAAITTSDSIEESTTRSSWRPTPRRRPPVTLTATTIAITSTTDSNTIAGLRPTWRRQTVADNGTDNTEGNDLKPNRGRGSIRYGSSELSIPATATAWTLVSLRSPPSSNTTQLVRQPDTEKASSTRGRRPAISTTQSSMQENRVSMVQVLAPLLVGEELANLSKASSFNINASSSEDTITTTEPNSSDTTTDLSSTLTTITSDITTLNSDIFTTQIPSIEESVITESSSNKSAENTETVTAQYDSTTLAMEENSTTTEVATGFPSEATTMRYNTNANSSEPENDSTKSNETTTSSTTFSPEVDHFLENSTKTITKLSNLEKESDSITQLFNITSAESATEDFHSVISSVNNTTIYSDETTTVANVINYSDVTEVNSAEMYSVNVTVSTEVTTVFPEIHKNISGPNSTLAQYSTNVTVNGNTTVADHVTKIVDVDDDLLSVTPLEAEEDDDSSTRHMIPTTTGTPSLESGEDDVHVFTHREDPDEEVFDQTTTTSSSIDFATEKQTTTLFQEKDVTRETTTESTASSSVSEIDWEQHTTIRPPGWDSTVSVYLRVVIESSWEVFCSMIPSFRNSVTEKFRECTQKDILPAQVVLDESSCSTREADAEQIEISMYLMNEKNEHDALLTTSFGSCFGSDNQLLGFVVERVEVMPLHEEESGVGGWGVIAAIAITCVGAVCLLIFLILMVILRKRQKKLNYGQRCTPVSLDAYSLDSVSICGSTRRKGGIRASKRSYGNAGFDDPGSPSHPMGFAGLANFVMNRAAIDEEFAKIPQVSASVDELPEGAETRNRYANVIPLPETRVALNLVNGDPLSHYINANFVRGPKEERKFYIACQAPLPSTVTDFWRMIWEQQSRAILMLTELVENGVEKCADYLPPSEVLDCHRLFGDFQVTLKKREVKEKYIISTLQLKNLETNSWREVSHLWYVGWPATGVPAEEDTASVIAFLLEARPHMRGGPTVVHCSPGTGRTGTVIACDLCIRDFETTRIVDVPRTVARIRRDRAGAVQTRDQYAFIYQVINLYGMKLTGGALDSI